MSGNQVKLDIKQADNRAIEQREDERRQTSTMTLAGALRYQRRRTHRRDNDHVNRYIDWYGHWPFAATVTITLLCFADAFLTIVLLSHGAIELNILMDWLIQRDVHAFAVVKMAVTGMALVVLVMHFNFRIYRFIAVRYLIYALVPMYSLLILHEISMLADL
jgi:Domain of unknown function (DUF5658)